MVALERPSCAAMSLARSPAVQRSATLAAVDAELLAQERPGQRHALAGGEHAAGALGPSDRPKRGPGAGAAAGIGGGGRGHRSILRAARPAGAALSLQLRARRTVPQACRHVSSFRSVEALDGQIALASGAAALDTRALA
jgi:hypothetical protein